MASFKKRACTLCGVPCNSAMQLCAHTLGTKHKMKLQFVAPHETRLLGRLQYFLDSHMAAEPAPGLEYIVEAQVDSSYRYTCRLCEVEANCKDMVTHIYDSDHIGRYIDREHHDVMVPEESYSNKLDYVRDVKKYALTLFQRNGNKKIQSLPDFYIAPPEENDGGKVGADSHEGGAEREERSKERPRHSPPRRSPSRHSPPRRSPSRRSPSRRNLPRHSPSRRSPARNSPSRNNPLPRSPPRRSPPRSSSPSYRRDSGDNQKRYNPEDRKSFPSRRPPSSRRNQRDFHGGPNRYAQKGGYAAKTDGDDQVSPDAGRRGRNYSFPNRRGVGRAGRGWSKGRPQANHDSKSDEGPFIHPAIAEIDFYKNGEFLDYLQSFDIGDDDDATFVREITQNFTTALLKYRERLQRHQAMMRHEPLPPPIVLDRHRPARDDPIPIRHLNPAPNKLDKRRPNRDDPIPVRHLRPAPGVQDVRRPSRDDPIPVRHLRPTPGVQDERRPSRDDPIPVRHLCPAPPTPAPPPVAARSPASLFPKNPATDIFFESIKTMEENEVMHVLQKIAATNEAFRGIDIPSVVKYLKDTGMIMKR